MLTPKAQEHKIWPEKVFSTNNPPPHLSSQNDQRDVGIILSHRCWVDPPPPPARQVGHPRPEPPPPVTAAKEGGGGLGKWASVSPPPPPRAIFFPPSAGGDTPMAHPKLCDGMTNCAVHLAEKGPGRDAEHHCDQQQQNGTLTTQPLWQSPPWLLVLLLHQGCCWGCALASISPPKRTCDPHSGATRRPTWRGGTRWTTRTPEGGVEALGRTHTETRRGMWWMTRVQSGVGSTNRKMTPTRTPTPTTTPTSTTPACQLLGSADAETTPAATQTAAVRIQRPNEARTGKDG